MSQFTNPYEPPKSEIAAAPPDSNEYLVDASSGLRLGNLLIDYVAFFIFSVAISVVLHTLAALTGNKVPAELGQMLGLVEWVAYYVLFEATLGRTPGKFITRTRVVNRAGGKPTFGQIVGRSFARLVPFKAFSFLGSRGGWHDRWSHTRVVRIAR
ncbi:MAG TPA: RDD family protein [Polyangiaceae bacterium]